jgi:hypothetical protein
MKNYRSRPTARMGEWQQPPMQQLFIGGGLPFHPVS